MMSIVEMCLQSLSISDDFVLLLSPYEIPRRRDSSGPIVHRCCQRKLLALCSFWQLCYITKSNYKQV
ncbi:hypothetical protein RB195_003175 [Necator americanus]|uniref:Uncharacterized protein n=1 Tax=Necator americanus TaxID=51031 RepID=A0ABR1DQ50_NECAM